MKTAPPSTPCRIAGLTPVKGGRIFGAGDEFLVAKDLKAAENIAEKRARSRESSEQIAAEVSARRYARAADRAREDAQETAVPGAVVGGRPAKRNFSLKKEEAAPDLGPVVVPAVMRVQSDGEAEALKSLLEGIPKTKAVLSIIAGVGIGAVGRGQVELAASVGAPIFAWNVGVTAPDVLEVARRGHVEIRRHAIVYALLDDIRAHVASKLPAIETIELSGRAEVAEIFSVNKGETVAGCRVFDGTIDRTKACRVIRGGEVVYTQSHGMKMLKHFKDEVKIIKQGSECGIQLYTKKEFEVQVGDTIENYSIKLSPAALD